MTPRISKTLLSPPAFFFKSVNKAPLQHPWNLTQLVLGVLVWWQGGGPGEQGGSSSTDPPPCDTAT